MRKTNSQRIEGLCAWCGPLFGVLFAVAMLVGHLVPPPSSATGAAGIARFYGTHAQELKWGMLVAMVATPLIIPFAALISRQLRASDERLAPLATVQMACAVVLVVEILLFVVLVAAGAMRPGRDPQVLLGLNDVAFLFLLWAFAPGSLEFAAFGVAVLWDRSEEPLFPRWAGWVDIAMALVFVLGGPTLFVTGGAFGWDGVIAFWAVFLAYGGWLLVTFGCLLRASRTIAARSSG